MNIVSKTQVDLGRGVDAILDIHRSIHWTSFDDNLSIKRLIEYKNYTFFAEIAGKIIGYATIKPIKNNNYYLSFIAVHKDNQGKKIGLALLNKVMNQAISLNVKKLKADYEVIENLSKFYERDLAVDGFKTKQRKMSPFTSGVKENRITYYLQPGTNKHKAIPK